MYLIAFPLLLIPFAFFNIVVFLLNMPLSDEEKSAVFELPLASEPTLPLVFDHSLTITMGDFIVAVGIFLLYVEDKDSGELRRPHHIDLKTGMYRGRQVLKSKKEA